MSYLVPCCPARPSLAAMLGCFWPQRRRADEEDYGGSRLKKQRWEYQETSLAGVLEPGVAHSQGSPGEQVARFRQALLAVRGVDSVEDHPKGSKASQGNLGSTSRRRTSG